MARKYRSESQTGRTILLVDDNTDYLEATRLVLLREGHTVITENSGSRALEIIKTTPIDLLLVDYYMPGMTGEQVVTELRKFNTILQVILQTGYASENPPRELLRRLDIQGYYDKSEGTEKLLLWVDVGLKSAYAVQLLTKGRMGLEYILSITPEMHKIQPLEELLQGILLQISGLLGSANSFLAVLTASRRDPSFEGFLAMIDSDDSSLKIHAGVGKFSGKERIDHSVPETVTSEIRNTLQHGNLSVGHGMTLIPLRVGESSIGIIYMDSEINTGTDSELLKVFANQAAVAIQNTRLYEMATLDPLTGVYVRRFFNQYFLHELKSAVRLKNSISLLMLDLDNMKHLNDTAGHLVGDKALVLFARSLKEATRTSDLISRFGGDEFCILLLKSDLEGMEHVIRRIREKIHAQTIRIGDEDYHLKASIGAAVLMPPEQDTGAHTQADYFTRLVQYIHQAADESLYEAKKAGGDRSGTARVLTWPEPSLLSPIAEVEQPDQIPT